ncbi:hypothetical protein ACFYY2_13380 [Streptomyces sp. NPDC001822]|uniref:hypothetical protein n=1 Tax=Streptomyces sp. NPDC001822 TaxID=3364614 RepID=UPI0036ACCE92
MHPAQRAGTLLGIHLLAALYTAALAPPPPAGPPGTVPAVLSGPGPATAEPWRAAWHRSLLSRRSPERRADRPPVRPAVGGAPAWTHTCVRGDEPSCPQSGQARDRPSVPQ